jgi:hypothetical protein
VSGAASRDPTVSSRALGAATAATVRRTIASSGRSPWTGLHNSAICVRLLAGQSLTLAAPGRRSGVGYGVKSA